MFLYENGIEKLGVGNKINYKKSFRKISGFFKKRFRDFPDFDHKIPDF